MVNPSAWFIWTLAFTVVPFSLLAAYRYMGRLYGGF